MVLISTISKIVVIVDMSQHYFQFFTMLTLLNCYFDLYLLILKMECRVQFNTTTGKHYSSWVHTSKKIINLIIFHHPTYYNTNYFCAQVGKGRDVGLNQIALFEGKVASGNGEQVLSRDVYRLGQLFDFFRMMSFYYTTVGFYFCTMVCSFFIFRKAFTRNLLKKYYTTTYDNFNSSRWLIFYIKRGKNKIDKQKRKEINKEINK